MHGPNEFVSEKQLTFQRTISHVAVGTNVLVQSDFRPDLFKM
jgi:hypothetical protein